MSKEHEQDHKELAKTEHLGLSRRRFLGATAVAGVAGVAGLGGAVMSREAFAAAAKEARNNIHVGPGELDE